MEEESAHTIVGHQDVRPAILIDVAGHHAQGFPLGRSAHVRNADTDPGGYIFEAPTPHIAIKEALRSLEASGWPISPHALNLVVLLQIQGGRPVNVVANEEVEASVAVVVQEGGGAAKCEWHFLLEEVGVERRGPASGPSYPCSLGSVNEVPAAVGGLLV